MIGQLQNLTKIKLGDLGEFLVERTMKPLLFQNEKDMWLEVEGYYVSENNKTMIPAILEEYIMINNKYLDNDDFLFRVLDKSNYNVITTNFWREKYVENELNGRVVIVTKLARFTTLNSQESYRNDKINSRGKGGWKWKSYSCYSLKFQLEDSKILIPFLPLFFPKKIPCQKFLFLLKFNPRRKGYARKRERIGRISRNRW